VRTEWQEELFTMYAASKKVASAETAFEIIAEAARYIGFEHCSYEAKLPLPLAEPRFLLLDNFDGGLRERYHQSRRSMASWHRKDVDIFDWSITRRRRGVDGAVEALFEALTVQANATAGCFAYFTVLNDAKQLRGDRIGLLCLAHLAHRQIYQHIEASTRNRVEPLSRREIDVIGWTADGKTSNEVATLLGVSEATVNFHIKNAKEKLGSSSKTGSAVKAAMLGMLGPRVCREDSGFRLFFGIQPAESSP
jgi:LuxR family transcriptional regulator, quorum-sensing system regulator SolR